MLRGILPIIILMMSINFAFANDFKALWQKEGGTIKVGPETKEEAIDIEQDRYEVFTSGQFEWGDYKKPFKKTLRICRNKRVLISVVLPKEILDNRKSLPLVIDLESGIITVTDGLRQKNFELLSPLISVNEAIFFGKYHIPVNRMKDRQVCTVMIDSDHLNIGVNTLEFIVGRENYRDIGGGCFGFRVHSLSLE